MTEASTGLRKALARAGDGSVVALSEMQAADIMAGLTDEQKVELAASLPAAAAPAAAAAAADPMEPKKDGCSEDGDEDDKDGEADPGMKKKADGTSGAAVADPRIKTVAAAVASDDNCKGKADLALQMLADDDYAGLSASGIVKLLGKQPATAAAAGIDPEAAARADMKAAISSTTNSSIDATGGAVASDKASASQSIWAKVTAEMNSKA